MPYTTLVADRSHADRIAAGVEIVTCHRVTVIVRTRIGSRWARVGGVISVRIVVVEWAAEHVAAHHAGAERSDNRAILNAILGLIDPPPDPVFIFKAVGVSRTASRKDVVIVVQVHRHTEPYLLEIVRATCVTRFGFGFSEGGQEDRRQNRDNGDNDEQFD